MIEMICFGAVILVICITFWFIYDKIKDICCANCCLKDECDKASKEGKVPPCGAFDDIGHFPDVPPPPKAINTRAT